MTWKPSKPTGASLRRANPARRRPRNHAARFRGRLLSGVGERRPVEFGDLAADAERPKTRSGGNTVGRLDMRGSRAMWQRKKVESVVNV